MVHCECANRELLNASFQDSQTPDRYCTHRDRPDRPCAKSECTDRQGALAVLPVLITPVAFFVRIISPFRLRPCALSLLSLAQDGSGKSFVHSMCGPYLQGCGNKLRVLVCIDIEHLAPTHANDVNAVVVIG